MEKLNTKYELTDEIKVIDGHTLYRIKALRDFSDVKKGDLGGFVETEHNLATVHFCWIYDDSCVYQLAKIIGNAQLRGDAKVKGKVRIGNQAIIHS